MDIKKNRISGPQYMCLTAGFVYGSYLLMTFSTGTAGHDIWIILLTGFAATVPLILCMASLIKMYPDKTFNQILESVYGSFLGRIFSLIYFLYFFLLISFNLYVLFGFYSGFVMPDTPPYIVAALFALLCVYAAHKGIESLAKVSVLIIVIGYLVSCMTSALLVGNMDFDNFLPFFDLSRNDFFRNSAIVSFIIFGEVIALLYISPLVHSKEHITARLFEGLGIIALLFMIILVRNVSTLGLASTVYAQSAYQSVRMINISDFITRIELMVTIALTGGLFIKISILFYAASMDFAQIFRLKSYRSVLLPLASIAVVLTLRRYPSSVNHTDWGNNYALFYSTPFDVVFPMLTWVIAKIRMKLLKKPQGSTP